MSRKESISKQQHRLMRDNVPPMVLPLEHLLKAQFSKRKK